MSSLPPACLRAPEFFGVHTISLGEEKLLDGGRLRVWSGAAVHNDLVSAMRQSAAVSEKNSISSPGASGNVLSGPFLRAAFTADDGNEKLLHVWLRPQAAEGCEISPFATADSDVIHSLGPYRVRVLRAEVTEGGVGTDSSSLQRVETMDVTLSADRAPPGARVALGEIPLPACAGEQATFWLSTQGALTAALGDAAAPADGCAGGTPGRGGGPATPPRGAGATPSASSLPPIGCVEPEVAGAETIDVELHAAPLRPQESEGPFGCAPWEWSAVLSAMCVGGESEGHASVKLRPADADAEGPPPVRLGKYELRVLQCTGHHATAAPGAGSVLSAYPILLLHVHVGVSLAAAGEDGELDDEASEARRLGEGLESLLG